MTEPFDFENFIYIGSKIADKIYLIPRDDQIWFEKQKEEIISNREKLERIKDLDVVLIGIETYLKRIQQILAINGGKE